MKNILFLTVILFAFTSAMEAQVYYTKSGKISFFSEAPLENIEAQNGTATFVIDFESGQVESAALIKAFQFEKALMQEHFNENYMESHKFPKAVFKGKIADHQNINLEESGEYEVEVEGNITIHGVTQPILTPAKLIVTDAGVNAHCEFTVAVADFDIEIPGVVRENIAKEIDIKINVELTELEQ